MFGVNLPDWARRYAADTEGEEDGIFVQERAVAWPIAAGGVWRAHWVSVRVMGGRRAHGLEVSETQIYSALENVSVPQKRKYVLESAHVELEHDGLSYDPREKEDSEEE